MVLKLLKIRLNRLDNRNPHLIINITRNFVSPEPRFEDEIYLPKLKFAFKARVQDMS